MISLEDSRSSELRHDRTRAFGAILMEQGKLTATQVEEIQRYASSHGLRFGEAAVQLNYLTPHDVDAVIALQYNYPVLFRGGDHGVSDDLVAAYNPQNPVVEPLRHLRSQIAIRWRGDVPRRVAIVSPGRGDGRSWLAANLATVFAQVGDRTLLIDADMRRPRQHSIFNLPNETGLSALLTGRAGKEIVRRINPHLRLFVLTAGLLPPNPQELLARPVFDLVLERFTELFDTVILDTPAIESAADAHLLAQRAGSALVVVRRNRTSQRALRSAMQSIMQPDISVLGSVISEH